MDRRAGAADDGDNPPITVAGSKDTTGARSTSTPWRSCGPRSTPRATGRPSRARPTRASSSCATASPRSATATTSRTSASSARSARTTATKTLVLIGDSHARAWIPAFDRINEAGNWKAYYLVKPQCTAAHVPIATAQSDDTVFTDCSDFQDWVIEQVEDLDPDLVVVASSPPVNGVFDGDERVTSIDETIPLLRTGYDELFLELDAAADEVVLLRDVPKSPEDPASCLSTGDPSLGDCMFEPDERSQILGDVAVESASVVRRPGRRPDPVALLPGRVPDRHRRLPDLPRHRPHHHRVRRQPLGHARPGAADDPGRRRRGSDQPRRGDRGRVRGLTTLAIVTVKLSQLAGAALLPAPVRRQPARHRRPGGRAREGRPRHGLGRRGVRLRLPHADGLPGRQDRAAPDRRGHPQRLLAHPGRDPADRRRPGQRVRRPRGAGARRLRAAGHRGLPRDALRQAARPHPRGHPAGPVRPQARAAGVERHLHDPAPRGPGPRARQAAEDPRPGPSATPSRSGSPRWATRTSR